MPGGAGPRPPAASRAVPVTLPWTPDSSSFLANNYSHSRVTEDTQVTPRQLALASPGLLAPHRLCGECSMPSVWCWGTFERSNKNTNDPSLPRLGTFVGTRVGWRVGGRPTVSSRGLDTQTHHSNWLAGPTGESYGRGSCPGRPVRPS